MVFKLRDTIMEARYFFIMIEETVKKPRIFYGPLISFSLGWKASNKYKPCWPGKGFYQSVQHSITLSLNRLDSRGEYLTFL